MSKELVVNIWQWEKWKCVKLWKRVCEHFGYGKKKKEDGEVYITAQVFKMYFHHHDSTLKAKFLYGVYKKGWVLHKECWKNKLNL